VAGRREALDQPARCARAIEVHHIGGRVANLKRGRVRQNQQLHDRHDQHLRQRRAVPDDVQRFGPREEENAAHGYPSNRS
jgi:hypothetical protein